MKKNLWLFIFLIFIGCHPTPITNSPRLPTSEELAEVDTEPGTSHEELGSSQGFLWPHDVIDKDDGDDPRDTPPPTIYGEEIDAIDDTIKVGSFNVLNMGHNIGARRAPQMRALANIISSYDLVVLQEIRGAQGAMMIINEIVQVTGTDYGFLYTPMQGKTAATSESHLYCWRRNKIMNVHRGGFLCEGDMMRCPYWAGFKVRFNHQKAFDFVLITLHTSPRADRIDGEVTTMGSIYENAINNFANDAASPGGLSYDELDVLIAGDMNAGPAPGRNPGSHDLRFRRTFGDHNTEPPAGGYFKAVGDSSTMANKPGGRANDNFCWGFPTKEDYAQDKGVDGSLFRNEQRKAGGGTLSDHYPIYAMFFAAKDSDN